jgi:hypothetical protein
VSMDSRRQGVKALGVGAEPREMHHVALMIVRVLDEVGLTLDKGLVFFEQECIFTIEKPRRHAPS